jgi:hypothetical protein
MPLRSRLLRPRLASSRTRESRLAPWLQLVGAVVAALATIVVAIIAQSGPPAPVSAARAPVSTSPVATPPGQQTTPGPGPSPSAAGPSGPADAVRNSGVGTAAGVSLPQPEATAPFTIGITSWTQTPLTGRPGEVFDFHGTALADGKPLPSGMYVFVIARRPAGAQTAAPGSAQDNALPPGTWLHSPPARLAADGTWEVQWTVPDPPVDATWQAVLLTTSSASHGNPWMNGELQAIQETLAQEGTAYHGILALAAAPPPHGP